MYTSLNNWQQKILLYCVIHRNFLVVSNNSVMIQHVVKYTCHCSGRYDFKQSQSTRKHCTDTQKRAQRKCEVLDLYLNAAMGPHSLLAAFKEPQAVTESFCRNVQLSAQSSMQFPTIVFWGSRVEYHSFHKDHVVPFDLFRYHLRFSRAARALNLNTDVRFAPLMPWVQVYHFQRVYCPFQPSSVWICPFTFHVWWHSCG